MTETEIQKRVDDFMRFVDEMCAKHGKFMLALSDYESEFDYFSLNSDPHDSFAEYQIVNRRIESELDKRGIKYDVHIIKFGEYLNWQNANGLENNGASRAQYVALKSKGAI